MSQEKKPKTYTIRRRVGKNGGKEYQIWPSDLSATAPEPSWHEEGDVPGALARSIMATRLDEAFERLPDGQEEVVMSEEEWDSYDVPVPEDGNPIQVDMPDIDDDQCDPFQKF